MTDDDEWVEFGFLPLKVIRGDDVDTWARASVNSRDGTIRVEELTDEEMDRAEKRYVEFLVDNNVITEEQAEDTLDWFQ